MKIIPDLEKRPLPLLRIYADDVRTLYSYFESAFDSQKCSIVTTVKTNKTYEDISKDELGEILLKKDPIKELQIVAAQKYELSGKVAKFNDPEYAILKLSPAEASLSMIDPDDQESLILVGLDGMKLKGFKVSIREFGRKKLRIIDSIVSEAGLPVALSAGYILFMVLAFQANPSVYFTIFIIVAFITAVIYSVIRYLRKVIRSKFVIFETMDRPEHRSFSELVKRYEREIVGAALALIVEIVFTLLVFIAIYFKDQLLAP